MQLGAVNGFKPLWLQVLFEQFKVPALNINHPCILNMLASGRSSVLTVDIGHCQTTLGVIYEGASCEHSVLVIAIECAIGYMIKEAEKKIAIGGNNITKLLGELLEAKGKTFTTVGAYGPG